MPRPLLVDADLVASGDVRGYLPEWLSDLRASGRAVRTRQTYQEAVAMFAAFLLERGLPTRIIDLGAEHVRAWINSLADRGMASTTQAARYAALRSFFAFLVREGELTVSPMAATKPPAIAEVPVPIIAADQYGAIRRACTGRSFEAIRDRALLDFMWTTGCRRAEVAGMLRDDVAFRPEGGGVARVTGKGARPRDVAFDTEAGASLKSYLRTRATRPQAAQDALWLGVRGPLTGSGIAQALRGRARSAGVADFHLHRLRHSWAHHMKMTGHTDETTATLGGWRSPRMLQRYGRSAATERAIDAYFTRPPR